MTKFSTLLASAAVIAVTGLSIGSASADQAQGAFPNFGLDTNGPSVIITFNANGSIATTNGGGYATYPHPYDGVEDTYFGIVNNSGHTIFSINLSVPGVDIFGFDGDGINTYGATGNATDTTGYGGPDAYFTGINAAKDSGVVNFIGGIGTGRQDYFSLEEALSITQIVVTGVPEPLTLSLFGAGLAGAFVLRRKTKKV